MDRENVIKTLTDVLSANEIYQCKTAEMSFEFIEMLQKLLKEQEGLLKHEYWRGYNNGRADERGLQDGTIMQTFSPD